MADLNKIIQDFSERYMVAVEREQAVRDAAFISDVDVIGDITVHSLTPRLFATLTLMKSPLVVGGEINAQSVLSFLWVVKVKEPNEDRQKFFEDIINKSNLDDIIKDVGAYFEEAFQDMPGGRDGKESVPYFSFMAILVDYMATEYGWTDTIVINMPYKRLFQYMRILSKRRDPEKVLFNKSDNLKSQMVQEIAKAQQ